ncbi:enoyl-CoA hydratase/isomerase family protein [Paeniglutamicibacter psychrophenolicus]|uniref:enoyl-CoA hydratase/isomerase family protein n=1 Tax=Paeniglutamicibacter psychrophenolicus TaxID=257454 RepID=UPI00278419D8|nr:enoyl-CoA hydratase/isomerase family protein [Paeniglutamicibacter psychrophenolicus]MDQ0093838.1 enoyl-CoA hydratase [Paeniglutamicibacter psychrophenolicus]
MAEPEVLLEVRGTLGVITLNRPRAVNALTALMAEAMLETLTDWAQDPAVDQVLVRGAGERGLCAGGDIVAIHRDIASGGTQTAGFWATEYRLNSLINAYPKPYIAYMDGLVLGGGVGISAHGSHRLVTTRTRSGMPETTIGFVPDVGGTYLLSRAPGQSGTHAALTGEHLGAAEVLYLGLADHLIDFNRAEELFSALEQTPVADLLPGFILPAPASQLESWRPWLDAAYGHDEVEDIVAALAVLADAGNEEARMSVATLAKKSPTALKLTLASLRRARELATLEEALEQEYRVGLRALASRDFPEGIRAQVIDKDYAPAWNPATLAEVDRELVEASFASLGERELKLNPRVPSDTTTTGGRT